MSSENPYKSPYLTASVEVNTPERKPEPDAEPEVELYLASRLSRFMNLVIDQSLLLVMFLYVDMSFMAEILSQEEIDMLNNSLCLLLFFAYYVVLEGLLGRTIGKIITFTRVVNEEGEKPSLGQILGRTAARLIPLEPFSFSLDPYPQGLHDRLAQTRVVSCRS